MKRFLVLATIIFVFILNGFALSAPIKPDKEGFIRDWLICGPFPNPGSHPETKVFPGWTTDWLKKAGGEANLDPEVGMYYEVSFPDVKSVDAKGKTVQPWDSGEIEVEWRKFFSDESKINLLEAFVEGQIGIDGVERPVNFVAGYVYCVVVSPKEQDVILSFGSDDGFKIWLNHKLIGSLCERRGSKIDQDLFPVHLKKGKNPLMVKIDQSAGGYNFYLRFLCKDKKPITDLQILYTKE